MDGWIKIHRQLLEWEWYDDTNAVRVFLHLLLSANFEPKRWKGITIERGQLVTSVANLANETHLTPKQIRIVLDKLKNTNEIDTQGANKYTLITICKYDTYQGLDNAEGQTKGEQKANKGQTEGEQRATTKEIKNIRTKEEYTDADKSATRQTELFDVERVEKKETKHKYGEYKNVLLTEDEFGTLNAKYGKEAAAIIDNYSQYKEMKGYKCKRDYLAIVKWGVSAYRESQNKKTAHHIDTSERDNRNIDGIW